MVRMILFVAFVLAVIVLGPIATIWAWNTLFGVMHTIPYTLETWAAVVILGGLVTTKIKG